MKTVKIFFALFATIFATNLSQAQFEQNDKNKGDYALIALNYNADDDKADKETKTTQSGAKVVSVFQEGMAITQLNGKFGFINRQGVEVVLPRYEDARFFANHYAAVKQNGGWTFINKQGKKITNIRYDWVGAFSSNGTAAVQINGKWGFINEQGQEITAIKYEQIREFNQNGTALVKYNGKWYSITETGKEVPAAQDFDAAQANANSLISKG
jgi:hypothetical protein